MTEESRARASYVAIGFGVLLLAAVVLALIHGSCQIKFSSSSQQLAGEAMWRELELTKVEEMVDGHISGYEIRRDQIWVTVSDRHRDAHTYLLKHEGVSREEALERLAKKKAELEER